MLCSSPKDLKAHVPGHKKAEKVRGQPWSAVLNVNVNVQTAYALVSDF